MKKKKPEKKTPKNGLYHVRCSDFGGMPVVAEITGNDGVFLSGKVYWRDGSITKTANAAWSADVRSDSDVIAECKQIGVNTKGATIVKYDLTSEYKSDHPSKWFVEEKKEEGPYPITVGLWQAGDESIWEVLHVGTGHSNHLDRCIGRSVDGKYVRTWYACSGFRVIESDAYEQAERLVRKLSPEVKKEKRIRPWKPEEVPVDAWFASKQNNDVMKKIHRFYIKTGEVAFGDSFIMTRSTLLENHTHSTDGGKTWKPCGVEEEA